MAWIYDDTRNQNRYGFASSQCPDAENNAWQVYNYLGGYMTLEALCGILGNISQESYVNPLQEQVFSGTPPVQNQRGLGLIQWTPQTSLTEFCNDYTKGDDQCELILNEITGYTGGRFYASVTHPEYSYTGQEFMELTDVEIATKAYFWERVRGTWSDARLTDANHWYEVLSGSPPGPGPHPTSTHKMPLYFYIARKLKQKKGLL